MIQSNRVEMDDLGSPSSAQSSATVTSKRGPHILAAVFLMTFLTGLYFLRVLVQPGWATYLLSVLPLVVIVITALARVSDITTNLTGIRWHARRFGLVLAGAGAAALVIFPVSGYGFPTWSEVILEWGVALTWFTTPGMPPWWRFIAGKQLP